MPRSAAFMAIVCALTLPVSAQAYNWTDENGRVHFSNFPPEQGDAIEVDTTPKNVADGVATPPAMAAPPPSKRTTRARNL